MNRYCIVDGCKQIISQGARCPRHTLPSRSTARWQKARARAINQRVERYGLTCPGYGCAPHPATRLEGDHRVSLVQGGELTGANVGVLCPSCNKRKGGWGSP